MRAMGKFWEMGSNLCRISSRWWGGVVLGKYRVHYNSSESGAWVWLSKLFKKRETQSGLRLATVTQRRNRDKKCALSRESEGWVNFEHCPEEKPSSFTLKSVSHPISVWGLGKYPVRQNSSAVHRITLIVKLSDFRQRETKLKLYLRIETRLRKTNKKCTRSRECEGWINFWQLAQRNMFGFYTEIMSLCHISSQWGDWLNTEFAKTRQSVRCLARILEAFCFQSETQSVLRLALETRVRKKDKKYTRSLDCGGPGKFWLLFPTNNDLVSYLI